MKKVLILILAICILVLPGGCSAKAQCAYTDITELEVLMDEQLLKMEAAHQMAEGARGLGYSEDCDIIKLAQEEWWKYHGIYEEYKASCENYRVVWETKRSEYPVATFIWEFLKDEGYSDEVTAGIIGNMMAEVGGQTLNIKPNLYGSAYYGICQWGKHYPDVWGKPLEDQCEFLRNTIQYELNTYGYKYKKGFNYDKFLELTNSKDAALAFAATYERCSSGSYKVRQNNAMNAYNYFVG